MDHLKKLFPNFGRVKVKNTITPCETLIEGISAKTTSNTFLEIPETYTSENNE
jgi:hypothetical protein